MAPVTPLHKARERSFAEARIALLRARGTSLAAIARLLGFDPSFISHVNAGRRAATTASRRVERALARALGLSLREAFPERYRRGRAA